MLICGLEGSTEEGGLIGRVSQGPFRNFPSTSNAWNYTNFGVFLIGRYTEAQILLKILLFVSENS